MKNKKIILTVILMTVFSCVPVDKEGIPEEQGYYHDHYYNLFIEGRVKTTGTASYCDSGWKFNSETRQLTCNTRTTTKQNYSYDSPTGPLPIEPLIGTIEKICLDEFRSKQGIYQYCSKKSGNLLYPWVDTNINLPATESGAEEMYKENFCGQQMLLCVGHRLMELSQAVSPVPFEGYPLDVRITELENGDLPYPLPEWLIIFMFENGMSGTSISYAKCLVDNDKALVSSCHQKYLIPPQSAENRTLLLLSAFSAFRESVIRGLFQLGNGVSEENAINGIKMISEPPEVYGEEHELLDKFITSHTEAVNLYIESLQKLIENQIAVASSYAGSNPDLATARQLEWNGPINSRSVALRFLYDSEPPLVEGEGGAMVPTSTYFKVIDTDPNKKEVRNAINLIRSLGIKIPSEAELSDKGELINNVESRIMRAIYEDRCWLISADDTPSKLLGKLQISEDDLFLAIRYLQQENNAFLRPEIEIPFTEPDYPFPCDSSISWDEIHEPRFANIRNLPWQIPVRFYIARYATYPWPSKLISGVRESIVHTANRSLAKIGTRSIAGLYLLGLAKERDPLHYLWGGQALKYTPLLSTASQQAVNIAGNLRVGVIYEKSVPTEPNGWPEDKRQGISLILNGDGVWEDKSAPAPSWCTKGNKVLEEKLLVVQSADADDETTRLIQCVLTGAVEGQKCNLEDISLTEPLEIQPVETCSSTGSGLWLGYRKYHFVLHRDYPAYAFRLAGNRSYELIAVWTPGALNRALEINNSSGPSEPPSGTEYVLGGEMEDWAQDILQRSILDAGRIAVGEVSPPLENEIISNSNEYEDSWRHYIDVAKESSAKADELGNEIIQAGLEMDLRAEAALDELEQICGGVMNVGKLPCDPALESCEPPATCDGKDISGCSNIPLQGNGAGEGEINPSLSSCLSLGKKARKADFLSLGPEMCFWLNKDFRMCGSEGVVRSDVLEGPLPPCPIRKTGECNESTFPIQPATSNDFLVILGNHYATSETDETIDTGKWVGPKPKNAPTGWRLRSMGLFDPTKENSTTYIPPVAPVCESIKILHRGSGCLGSNSSTGELIFIPATGGDDCVSKGGTWYYEGHPEWNKKVGEIIKHIRDNQKWLDKQHLHKALSSIFLDADLAHHYQLYINDKLVFSTYQSDQQNFSGENLDKIFEKFPVKSSPSEILEYESQREGIGHSLQGIILTLGFFSGEITNISVGFPALAEPEINSIPYLNANDYLYDPSFFNDPWYSYFCDSSSYFNVAILEDPTLKKKIGDKDSQCQGDESCRCLYCIWPFNIGDEGKVKNRLKDFVESQGSAENIPCIYGGALSVRDECVVHYTPHDATSEMNLERDINYFDSFWAPFLRSASSNSDLKLFNPYGYWFSRDSEACEIDSDSFTSPDTLLMKAYWDSYLHFIHNNDEISNVIWYGPSNRDTFFQSLELACYALEDSEGSIQCADFDPEEITKYDIDNVSELHLLTQYLHCAAGAFYEAGSRIVVSGVPEVVIKNAQTDKMEINQGEYGGEILQVVNSIEQDLEDLVEIPQDISWELSTASQHIETFRLHMSGQQIRYEIEQLRNTQSKWVHTASALSSLGQAMSAIASAVGAATTKGPFGAGQAAAESVAAGLYAAAAGFYAEAARIDSEIESKTEVAQEYEWAADFNKMQEDLLVSLANLRDLYRKMGDTLRNLVNDLEAYDRLQRKAQTLLAKATFADSDPAGRTYNVNTVMRRRLNTLQARYEKQLSIAKKAAKRALKSVEFRTGIKLSSETQDMDLIPAPSTWVDKLDKLQGIDYSKIRCVPSAPPMNAGETPEQTPQSGEGIDNGLADSQCMNVENFAEEYIGDWINLLEGYMESYSSAHSFSDGEDYAVISLRDDIFSVKELCQIETKNLLYFSEDLSRYTRRLGPEEHPAPNAMVGWKIAGCPEAEFICEPENPEICEPSTACLTVYAQTEENIPCGYQQDDLTGAKIPYNCAGRYSKISDTEGLTPYSGKVVQVIEDLPRGVYILSWFDRAGRGGGPTPPPPYVAHPYIVTFDIPDTGVNEWNNALSFTVDEDLNWSVKRIMLKVEQMTDLRIGIDPSLSQTEAGSIDISAIQLVYHDTYESADTYFDESEWTDGGIIDGILIPGESKPELLPRPYEPTGNSRLKPGLCPDNDGDAFRWMFAHKCDYLCRDGFGERECSGDDPNAFPMWCYYEIPFHISLEELETGELVPSGAIAIGNFNFRHMEVGLNIVGTNVIDCSQTSYPSTCYTNSFLQYTLQHGGNVTVRNHLGENIPFYLPTASIEHQKALSTETVLTNPPTGNQRELLTEYMNKEFWGRPLTGDYLLKIWDTEGLFWPHVEDIQIVLKYRYWTRHTK